MSAPQQKKSTNSVWFLPVVVIVGGVLANFVGDMLFICILYGPHTYFGEGLRIAKHKPYTLSTGTVLSTNLASLGWFTDAVLWLGFVILFMYILKCVSRVLRRFILRPE